LEAQNLLFYVYIRIYIYMYIYEHIIINYVIFSQIGMLKIDSLNKEENIGSSKSSLLCIYMYIYIYEHIIINYVIFSQILNV
jgi:hypothetical protein